MSRKSFNAGALLAPVPPALVSCGTEENPNVLTIGWTGIICTKPPMTYISVRPERHSYNIIKQTGEFVINLASENLCRAVDYCGVRSGKNTDKFKDCNLTPVKSEKVSAPTISECPVSLECKVTEIKPLGSHDMFIAEIVNVSVKENLIDQNERIDFSSAHLLAYSHGEYFSLGKKLGSFGYSVKKNRTKKKKKK